MRVYREATAKSCSECCRPLDIIECEEGGTPGVFCSPQCIDISKRRSSQAPGVEQEKKT